MEQLINQRQYRVVALYFIQSHGIRTVLQSVIVPPSGLHVPKVLNDASDHRNIYCTRIDIFYRNKCLFLLHMCIKDMY